MVPLPTTPRRIVPARQRISTRPTQPKSAGPIRSEKATTTNISSEPPRKKLRYIPGGPGGGGRYVDDDGTEIPVGGTGPGGYNYVGPRGRIGRQNLAKGLTPTVTPRIRDRTTRTRPATSRSQPAPMRFPPSAAQVAAVVQSDGYKPREERAYEEFHPELDIGSPMLAFSSDEVEGIKSRPVTPGGPPLSAEGSVNGMNGVSSPNGIEASNNKSEGIITPAPSLNGEPLLTISIPGTPGGGKRRPGRPPKDPVGFYQKKAAQLGKSLNIGTPKAPKIAPIPPVQNTNAKERLVLPQPSYRKSDTLDRFEHDRASFVDKSMLNVGYQSTDIFIRDEERLIKIDTSLEEDLDLGLGHKHDGETIVTIGSGGIGRVEYDMDEQDEKWLDAYNEERKASNNSKITSEIFEITITKIEKEWHALEKRIPKANPKPPQTHRPRSSSAAAVNGEPQAGEEQDSKCTICDDGDCENTNAIVFCDGCDLAVHQECYGVPFIPEGQWLCRKCQLVGRGIPTCIFCPNTEGAFKQTNASKWAHLLCAMWIPEVSLGNHTFMEPVMDVEKVPKTRWKLTCYLCNQRMGACIQCGNKACYQAFHVTCARRARLFLKMKNGHGTLAVLDGTTTLKAFCDKHCPSDYAKENDVAGATRQAMRFYKKTMRGRLWAESQENALDLAAQFQHAVTEHQPDESQLTGERLEHALGESKKKGNQPAKPIWKLPSGAPVIPHVLFAAIETSLQRYTINKRKDYTADVCRYWTLKREARRGAPLLKRLQLQMDTFSSMELTRRNFPGMGPSGRSRLARRIGFAESLVGELNQLKELSTEIIHREEVKLTAALNQKQQIESVYFPVAKLLPKIVDQAIESDKQSIFTGLSKLQEKVKVRVYTSALNFANELSTVFSAGISNEPPAKHEVNEADKTSPSKKHVVDMKERKKAARRIIKTLQPLLEEAVQAEADWSSQDAEAPLKDLERLLEAIFQPQPDSSNHRSESGSRGEAIVDIDMSDVVQKQDDETSGTNGKNHEALPGAADVDMENTDAPHEGTDDVDAVLVVSGSSQEENANEETITTTALAEVNGNKSPMKTNHINGNKFSPTSNETNESVAIAEIDRPGPPTPPTSNDSVATEYGSKVLAEGGIPLFLRKDFQIDGTKISALDMNEDLEDMDEDQVNGLQNGAVGGEAGGQIGGAKNKKGKGKKRKTNSRSR